MPGELPVTPFEESARPRSMRLRDIAGHKFFLLFLFLLSYLLLYSYKEHGGLGYFVFRGLAVAVTLMSVYAVSFRRSLVFLGLALAIPAVVEHVQIVRSDASALSILTSALTLAFDAFIIVVIFRRVFFHGDSDSETIFGALCIYLLVGLSFASIYRLVSAVQPHAFYLDPQTNLRSIPNRFDLIYYSFGTMTSLGAAGITAVSDQARSLTVIEAIIGLLYLAVMISRLVGTYRASRRDEYRGVEQV